MKMNFLGLHTYPIPQSPVVGPGGTTNISGVCGMLSAPEPTVWVGLDDQFDHTTGQVTTSYPSTFFLTLGFMGGDVFKGQGGGLPMNTSAFTFGSGQVFPSALDSPFELELLRPDSATMPRPWPYLGLPSSPCLGRATMPTAVPRPVSVAVPRPVSATVPPCLPASATMPAAVPRPISVAVPRPCLACPVEHFIW
eukprot:SAG11_NODE_9282_length_926_cov_1.361548_1_plen_195_part_00